MSTHYMADADNMVFPTVVNPKTFNPLDVYTQPGKLQYLDKPGPVVDKKTGKTAQECKKIKVHKKLEGTEIPAKK